MVKMSRQDMGLSASGPISVGGGSQWGWAYLWSPFCLSRMVGLYGVGVIWGARMQRQNILFPILLMNKLKNKTKK